MEVGGIKFAPLYVPFERRLQTLAAAAWFFTMAFGGPLFIFLCIYLILFTRLWWITSLYVLWIFTIDKDTAVKGGRPSKWVQSWLWWKYLRDYFPATLERLPWVELDPKRNYLFCGFPHGMLATGVFANFSTGYGDFKKYFPHHTARVVTLSQHYIIPFYRELGLSLNGVAADAKSIEYLLSRPEGGHVCVLMVGGAAESYYCKPGMYKVILKKRKGFVKLALRNGSALVPVLTFGETDLFDQLGEEGSALRKVQETLRKWIGMAPAIPIGRGFFQYNFGLVPRRKPITTVVGQPMDVPKIENPSNEQINEYHAKFVEHLTKMFEEQKYNYLDNPEEKKLIIE